MVVVLAAAGDLRVACFDHFDAVRDALTYWVVGEKFARARRYLARACPWVLLGTTKLMAGLTELWDLAVNLQEYGDAGDVVDDCVVLSPLLGSCADDCVASLLGAVDLVERPHYLTDLLVRQELPNSVAGDHQELVFRSQLEAHDFGVSADTNHMSE